jgi:hypothetical protein
MIALYVSTIQPPDGLHDTKHGLGLCDANQSSPVKDVVCSIVSVILQIADRSFKQRLDVSDMNLWNVTH